MSEEGAPRFEVSVNGETITTAGYPDFGVLTAILCWVKRDPAEHASEEPGYFDEDLSVDVAGLHKGENADWASRSLQVGDEIVVRVLPPGPTDEPKSRRPGFPDKDFVFHIAPAEAWAAAQKTGTYEPESLRTEGFIHCSDEDQVYDVANERFSGRTDLLLLRIPKHDVEAEIRYEGGFPHIYGPLDVDAVHYVSPLVPGADDRFSP